MVAKDFEVDDLVWAKMKGFPPWPARIAQPQDPKSPSAKKQQHFVYFFGTHNYAWILDENITPHSHQMLKNSEGYKKKPATLQKAIRELEEEGIQEDSSEKLPSTEEKQQTPKRPAPKASVQKRAKKPRISPVEEETPEETKMGEPPSTDEPNSPSEPPSPTDETNSPEEKRGEDDEMSADKYAFSLESRPASNNGFSKVAVIPPFNDDSSAHPQPKSIIDRSVLPRPQTPPLDMHRRSQHLDVKPIEPTSKKIGFLGLGMMGRGMVKSLLDTGHDLTLWNRTREKCLPFAGQGAKVADTPSDVVAACDIIFCCVSDPGVVKKLVFGNCGILRGFDRMRPGKAYVEMTSVDPTTSMEVAEAVSDKGGRYMEAPVVGWRTKSEEGDMVVLGCGDQALFIECESCFSAMARHAYYVGCEIGAGARLNLALSMFAGNVYASLAESITLVESCKLSTANFMDVLEKGGLGCDLVGRTGRAMISNEFATRTALKHQQKDLSLALMLGNTQSQPLHMAAAANEIFKRARLLRYSEHDVAAVHIGTKI